MDECRRYAKAGLLPEREIAKDRNAFFGSILGALNHIMVADLFWLRRFSTSKVYADDLAPTCEFAMPAGLRDILYDDIHELADRREELDTLILGFAGTRTDDLLATPIHYRNIAGENLSLVKVALAAW